MNGQLKDQTLRHFIDLLDSQKMYFLASDIEKIYRKNQKLFANLKRKKCQGLYYIYSIYSKRMRERMEFAQKYLKQDPFLFKKDLHYTVDKKLRIWPKASTVANTKMKSYIQYQVANVFLVEKDIKKSVQQVSYILNNIEKQARSWKPILNKRELRECRQKSKNSFKACKPTKWFSAYLNAYSQSLDSHSSYLDGEDLEEFYISMNLKLEGIGATLSSKFGYTVVEKLIPGGAAEKSKQIKVKDKIIAVGQNKEELKPIFGERIEDVVSIIRGPKGTPVFLKVLREEEGKKAVSVVRLIRDKVDLKEEEASISYHNIESGGKKWKTGLLNIPSFYGSGLFGKSVSRDVRKLLMEAKKENIQSLVLDLSYNRGGSLDEAVYLSGLFFAEGNVVKQSERNQLKVHILKDTDERTFYRGPLTILINRLSASASEIVSGALQDYQRAVIVGGNHTFGKGSVQSVDPLSFNLGALKTTVGLYFIPSGKSTQKEGIQADISFPSLFSRKSLGEKKLENAIKTEVVKDFRSPPEEIFLSSPDENSWKPLNSIIISKLKKLSEKRVEKNEKFQKIANLVEALEKKAENRKTVSIEEVLTNQTEKEEEELKKAFQLDNNEKNQKGYFLRPDIQEALKVSADLAFMQSQMASAKRKKSF